VLNFKAKTFGVDERLTTDLIQSISLSISSDICHAMLRKWPDIG